MQWRMNACLPSFLLLDLSTSSMNPIAVGEGRGKRTILLFWINCRKAKCFCFNNVAQQNHCYKPVFRNRYLSQNTSQLRCVLGTLYDVFSSHSVERKAQSAWPCRNALMLRNLSSSCLPEGRTPILERNMLCSQVSPLTGCVLAFSILSLRFLELWIEEVSNGALPVICCFHGARRGSGSCCGCVLKAVWSDGIWFGVHRCQLWFLNLFPNLHPRISTRVCCRSFLSGWRLYS